MRIFLTISILLTFFGCRQIKKRVIEEKVEFGQSTNTISVDTSAIAIIGFDTLNHWLFTNARPTVLNWQQLEQIETILMDCISEYNYEQKSQFDLISKKYPKEKIRLMDFVIKLDRYKRQYISVINDRGEKEVWINCLCDTWDTDWKTEIIEVLDGGNCFFQLKINLTTKTYYNFMVNGVA